LQKRESARIARAGEPTARRVARIVALEHGGEPDFRALRAKRDEWNVRGRARGPNLDLTFAIEIARLLRVIAADKDQKGIALNVLGYTLSILGGRESGTASLEETVAIYRLALEERTRAKAARRVASMVETPNFWIVSNHNRKTVRRQSYFLIRGIERDHIPTVASRGRLGCLTS
jgi:hypothetical protein